MMIQTWIDSAIQDSLNFMIIFSKIAAVIGSLLIFRKEFIPTRILLLLSIALTIYVLKSGFYIPYTKNDPYYQWIFAVAYQAACGLLTGYIINLFTEIFLSIGQFISIQSGLGFVNLYIPKVGHITPMSQYLFIFSTIIFFQMNAHLVLIKLVLASFKVPFTLDISIIPELINYTKIIFSSTLMLSIPVIISILFSNLTLGIMTKFSPQINIFSIGINISLIITFLCLYLITDSLTNHGIILLNDILNFCEQLTLS